MSKNKDQTGENQQTQSRFWTVTIFIVLTVAFATVVWVMIASDYQSRAILLAAIIATASTAFTLSSNKKREIASSHRERKENGYMEYINIFFDVVDIKNPNKKEKELKNKMLEFRKTLLIWGSDETITTWNKLARSANDPNNRAELLRMSAEMLRSIRKDLGHNDFNLPASELLKLIIKAEEHDDMDKLGF